MFHVSLAHTSSHAFRPPRPLASPRLSWAGQGSGSLSDPAETNNTNALGRRAQCLRGCASVTRVVMRYRRPGGFSVSSPDNDCCRTSACGRGQELLVVCIGHEDEVY